MQLFQRKKMRPFCSERVPKFGSDPVNQLISEIRPNPPLHLKSPDVHLQGFPAPQISETAKNERTLQSAIQSHRKHQSRPRKKKKHPPQAHQRQDSANLPVALNALIHPGPRKLLHPQLGFRRIRNRNQLGLQRFNQPGLKPRPAE